MLSKRQVVAVTTAVFCQVAPLSKLIWTRSPDPSAVLLPVMMSVLSLVTKSPATPRSSLIAKISVVAVGTVVSTVMFNAGLGWLSLPAGSVRV